MTIWLVYARKQRSWFCLKTPHSVSTNTEMSAGVLMYKPCIHRKHDQETVEGMESHKKRLSDGNVKQQYTQYTKHNNTLKHINGVASSGGFNTSCCWEESWRPLLQVTHWWREKHLIKSQLSLFIAFSFSIAVKKNTSVSRDLRRHSWRRPSLHQKFCFQRSQMLKCSLELHQHPSTSWCEGSETCEGDWCHDVTSPRHIKRDRICGLQLNILSCSKTHWCFSLDEYPWIHTHSQTHTNPHMYTHCCAHTTCAKQRCSWLR